MRPDVLSVVHLTGRGRLVALIDGVFAVAITLLVLDLRLPAVIGEPATALMQMLPSFIVYLIVFASIAGYWVMHQRTFCFVERADGRLTVLSLLNLVFITLFPVAARIMGAQPLEPLAALCFSANSLLYCVSAWAVWSYGAAHPQLLANRVYEEHLQRIARIMLIVASVLALAIPLAFLNIYLAYADWILCTPIAAWISETFVPATRGRSAATANEDSSSPPAQSG